MEYNFFIIITIMKIEILNNGNSTIYGRIPLFQMIPYSGILCGRELRRGNDGNLMEFKNNTF